MSLVHHRDVATAVDLALTGAMDGRVVNIADDAPMSMYDLFGLVGAAVEPSAEPLIKLINPWFGQMDASLARSLGFPTGRHNRTPGAAGRCPLSGQVGGATGSGSVSGSPASMRRSPGGELATGLLD